MRGQVTPETRCRNKILLLAAQSWYQTDYNTTCTASDRYYQYVHKKIKRGRRRPKSQKPSSHPPAEKWYQTDYNTTCTAIDRYYQDGHKKIKRGKRCSKSQNRSSHPPAEKWYQTAYNSTLAAIDRYYDDVRKKIRRGKRLPKFIPKKLFSPHPPDDKKEDETFEKVSAKFAVKNLELVRGLISENRQFDDIFIKFGKACEFNDSSKVYFSRLFSLATKSPDSQKLSNQTVAGLVSRISLVAQRSRAETPHFDDVKLIKAKLYTIPKVAALNLDSDPLIAMCKTKYKGQAQCDYIASQLTRELSQHCQLLSTLTCIRSACQNLLNACKPTFTEATLTKATQTILWTADVLDKFNSSLNTAEINLLKRYHFDIADLVGKFTAKSPLTGNRG